MDIYVTPPINSYEEHILPDTIISDEYLSETINIKGSPGEIVPATFTIKSNEDKSIVVSEPDLQGIPVDIRVVKCWYQAGHELSGATIDTIELLPELLIKDDSLIALDIGNQNNYVKRTDGTYLMISERTYEWNPASPTIDEFPVQDSDTLQPIDLVAGENKQLWITVKIPSDAVPGTYSGVISIGTEAQVTISLTVLPIVFFTPSIETSLYYSARLDNGYPEGKMGNSPRSEQQMLAEFINMKEHGNINPTCYQSYTDLTLLGRCMELRQEAGLDNTNFYWLGLRLSSFGDNYTALQSKYLEMKDFLSNYGVENIYIYGPDEQDMNNPTTRARIDALHEVGGRLFNAQNKTKAPDIADVLDLCVLSGTVDDTYYADLYHSFGHKLYSYANPQVGLEKPETYRKNYGLYLWQRDFDGGMDFAYHYGPGNLWNDWDWIYDCYPPECDPERHRRYKQHVFAYPTLNGVVDTLQWEGFREGSTDLKYLFTLLHVVAIAKEKGKDTTDAEQFVSNLKTAVLSTLDMHQVRDDLINYILTLKSNATIDDTKTFQIAIA